MRLLVVEDHRDTATVLLRLLARRGYQVRSADSVASALETARTFPFDAIITDIGLPDGTGVELFQTLKAASGNQAIRGVALSGYGMEEDIDRSKAVGFSGHITKPVDFDLLLQCLSQIEEELSQPAIPTA